MAVNITAGTTSDLLSVMPNSDIFGQAIFASFNSSEMTDSLDRNVRLRFGSYPYSAATRHPPVCTTSAPTSSNSSRSPPLTPSVTAFCRTRSLWT
ncbi:uncharacterized protein LOC126413891 isoform X2 [Schistocerca serialis cubense]|uniref:uncharacterized protein LOC126413891 isoform X2 n=1 Tax=Schistocerca serialis cubense TaxID=2023355 RepID=UPI00214F04E8|nr:uncharacterized protein LOC126413891 isoform X2 [Schistocerca serialis cubense]